MKPPRYLILNLQTRRSCIWQNLKCIHFFRGLFSFLFWPKANQNHSSGYQPDQPLRVNNKIKQKLRLRFYISAFNPCPYKRHSKVKHIETWDYLLRFNTKLTNDCWLVVNTGNSKRVHSSALSQMIMSWHRVPIWQGHVACLGPSEPWGQGPEPGELGAGGLGTWGQGGLPHIFWQIGLPSFSEWTFIFKM